MKKKLRMIKLVGLCLLLAVANFVWPFGSQKAEATVPYVNEMVDLDSSGNQAYGGASPGGSSNGPSMSNDGQYVVFESSDPNLVTGDTNSRSDIFVKDRGTGQVTRVNVTSSGDQCTPTYSAACYAQDPLISYDGRYVGFSSNADNLTTPVQTGANSWDAFLHDMQTGTTETVNLSSSGSIGTHGSSYVDGISRDGRYVTFESDDTNLVSNDTNGQNDIFVRDRTTGTTTRLNVSNSGTEADGFSDGGSMSCDGSLVAFSSTADNLVPNDTNGNEDVFLVNRIGGNTISDITIGSTGVVVGRPFVSCDGSTVVFSTSASDLGPNDTNGYRDIYAYDVSTGKFSLVSQASDGTQENFQSDGYGGIGVSTDGRYVTFYSSSSNLVPNDTNGKDDIFLRDRVTNTTQRVSMRDATTQTNQDSSTPSISPNGSYVTFYSSDQGLVPSDTTSWSDMFIVKTGATPCSI